MSYDDWLTTDPPREYEPEEPEEPEDDDDAEHRSQHRISPETGQAECDCCCGWALDYDRLREQTMMLRAALNAFVEAWEKSHQLEKTDVAYGMALAALAKADANP